MKYIQLFEFGMPKDFVELRDIIKKLEERDWKFEFDMLEIKMMEKGQARRFIDGPIGASMVLWYLSAKMDQFKHQVMEMEDDLGVSMENIDLCTSTPKNIFSLNVLTMTKPTHWHNKHTTRNLHVDESNLLSILFTLGQLWNYLNMFIFYK